MRIKTSGILQNSSLFICTVLTCLHSTCMGQVQSQNIVGYSTTVNNTLTNGDFCYTLSAGVATVVDYTGSNSCMRIPDSIDGYPVKAVGQEIKGVFLGLSPFAKRKQVKRVVIPSSVSMINSGAFGTCGNLVEITLFSGVTNIDNWAFSGCTNLLAIIIPGSVQLIGEGAFKDCSSLAYFSVASDNKKFKDIDGVLFSHGGTELIQYPLGNKQSIYVIPDSVKIICMDAFRGSSLLHATVSKNITRIGWGSFADCKYLTHVTLGQKVKTIDDFAFARCSALRTITIPRSVQSIEDHAFEDCTALTYFSVATDNKMFKGVNGVVFSRDGTKLIQYPLGNQSSQYAISDVVTLIKESAFSGCFGVEQF